MPAIDKSAGVARFDELRRRTFSNTRMLKLGDDLLRDEARRLRDLLAFYVMPYLNRSRRMPTEEEIAREFHTSRNSARAALRLLASEHSIRRVVGVGTYADDEPKLWRSDRLSDSQATYPELTSDVALLGWHVEYDVPEALRRSFSPDATRLAIFEKRQGVNGMPGILRTFFVPLRSQDTLGPDDAPEDLLSIIEERFGHHPLRADRIVNAIAADESAATQLEVSVGAPLLYIQTAVYAPDDSLVLLYFLRQRGELLQLSMNPERIF